MFVDLQSLMSAIFFIFKENFNSNPCKIYPDISVFELIKLYIRLSKHTSFNIPLLL